MRMLAISFALAGLTGATLAVCRPQQAVAPGAESPLARGRGVAALLGNGDALFARFAPQMAASLPREKAVAFVRSLPKYGEPREEWATGDTYRARLAAPTGAEVMLDVVFDGDKIAGLTVRPTPVLSDEIRDAVRKAGRFAVRQMAAGDAVGVHARFTKAFAAQVSQQQARDLLAKAVPVPSPGVSPVADAVVSGEAIGTWGYEAVFDASPGQNVAVTIIFSDGMASKIAGCTIRTLPPARLAPDPRAGYRTKTTLRLPFAPGDSLTVLWGGDSRQQNRHVDAPDQRHAYDFLMVQNGATHTGDGRGCAQYLAWNKSLHAPAGGTVLETRNDLADNKPGVMRPDVALGNYVLIDFVNNEYGVLAHLRRGSVAVRVGQRVHTGDVVGRCGNSGNSSQPHLHFHLQNSPRPFGNALGLPAPFTGYAVNGKAVARACPVRGETVAVR